MGKCFPITPRKKEVPLALRGAVALGFQRCGQTQSYTGQPTVAPPGGPQGALGKLRGQWGAPSKGILGWFRI